ncbi:uncharacterized protein LOC122859507 [Aphidius gifuensis]|uniref:uncharacterized protein LOC122859507 n=1 Tax=Aphidius gifuensis TaxID=684658 RepID=UPI001CDCBAC9|nr:uncharacterized protein LOC122859507 [Aphidius gifuensis]
MAVARSPRRSLSLTSVNNDNNTLASSSVNFDHNKMVSDLNNIDLTCLTQLKTTKLGRPRKDSNKEDIPSVSGLTDLLKTLVEQQTTLLNQNILNNDKIDNLISNNNNMCKKLDEINGFVINKCTQIEQDLIQTKRSLGETVKKISDENITRVAVLQDGINNNSELIKRMNNIIVYNIPEENSITLTPKQRTDIDRDYKLNIALHPDVSSNVANHDTVTVNPATLDIYYQNCRSIKNKMNELFVNSLSTQLDVLLLTETWLAADISSYHFFDCSQYTVFRKDRNCISKCRGGGVLCALNNDSIVRCHQLKLPAVINYIYDIDTLGIFLEHRRCNYRIIILYIPPDFRVPRGSSNLHIIT